MKFKKALFGITSAAAVVAPIAATVACGSKGDYAQLTIKGSTTPSTVFVALDGHDHSATDKSFNQQGFEAVKEYAKKDPAVIAPAAPDGEAEFKQMYATADKNSIIVAPGFSHIKPLKSATEEIAGKKVVLIDGSVPKDNIISITFKVEQAAYLGGYALAQYALTDKGFNQLRGITGGPNDDKVVVSTFGGADYGTVTGFMSGFKLGFAKALEEENAKDPNNKSTHVGNVSFYKPATVAETFSNSFAAGGGSAITAKYKQAGVDVILPVAGPQTKDVLDAGLYAVGVDTAQENQYTNTQGKVLFSILKDIKNTTIEALKVITGDATASRTYFQYNSETVGTLENKYVGISNGTQAIKDLYDHAFNDNGLKAEALKQTTDWSGSNGAFHQK